MRGEEAASDVEFVSYQPGRMELRVSNPRDGWLYLAEKFAPGWRARLDGEPVRMMRAFVAFEALRVPAGTHEITLDVSAADDSNRRTRERREWSRHSRTSGDLATAPGSNGVSTPA